MKQLKIFLPFMYALIFCFSPVNAQTKIYSSSRAQYEPHIAVNPTNPNNLVAVTIGYLNDTDRKIGYSIVVEDHSSTKLIALILYLRTVKFPFAFYSSYLNFAIAL